MLREQRWTPDTCANPATGDACVLIEVWDDAVPVESRTHNFVRAEKLCSHHAAQHGANHAAAFTANYAENRRKNISWVAAQSVRSTLNLENFKWSYNEQRVLTVEFGGVLTTQQQSGLQNACDVQFGPGKVVVLR